MRRPIGFVEVSTLGTAGKNQSGDQTGANKHVADEIERVVDHASSIEEEMMLEAAELEEVEQPGESEAG